MTAQQPGPTLRAEPLVSVVVPTRNSARHLGTCLASILAQSVPPAEVIVCDNFSTDDTVQIAAAAGAIVIVQGPERSPQRNAAARLATGTHLFFVDSDMRLSPDVIEACLAAVAGGGGAIIVPEVVVGSSFWARCRNLEKRLGERQPGYEAARFMSRADFFRVGGYDERLVVGEDFDLHYSLLEGGVVEGRVEASIDHLEEGLSLRDYLKKWRYYASHVEPFVTKRGAVRRRVPTIVEVSIRQWRVAARDPLAFGGLIVLKVLGFGVIGWRLRFSRVSSGPRA